MVSTLLATTTSEGLRPLGSPAQRSYELVTGAVQERLGAAHAGIFAEPVAARHGDSIDWHAARPGRALRLEELSETERRGLTETLGRLVGDIRDEADRLATDGTAADQRLAEALRNATEVPGEEYIFALRDAGGALHPALVHWAWLRDEQRAVRGVLTALVPRPVPARAETAAASAAAAAAPAWLWWLLLLGWLLLAAMIAAILWLMLAPCGLNPLGPRFCAAPPERIEAAFTEAAVAADEVAAWEREIALAARQCQPTVPVRPADRREGRAEPPPAAPDAEEIGQRLADRGAARGALNFTLEWETTDDVDLYVTCPTGATISYLNTGDCDGRYDLDANVRRKGAVADPMENIVFDEARPGIYRVRAHLRSDRTGGAKKVVLHVLRRDGPSLSYEGMLGDGQVEWTKNISISR